MSDDNTTGNEARDLVWDIREEGVGLRDEGIQGKFESLDEWTTKCLDWEKRMIEAVRAVDAELARRLRPLGGLDVVDPDDAYSMLCSGGRKHVKNVAAMTTIMRLVERGMLGAWA